MEELERPKRKALSDAELAKELAKFPSDNIGIERAQRLIAEQQSLREQDSADLQQWFDQMRQRDDAFSKGIIKETLAELFPQPEQTKPAAPMPEPAFTSEIPIVSRRRVVSQRFQITQLGNGVNIAILLAVITAGVGAWLSVSGLDLLLAYAFGSSLAILASYQLRDHELHPLLRSAAVVGGRGVYWFSPLLLIAFGLLLFTAINDETSLGEIKFEFGYQAVVVLVAGLAAILAQIVPVRFQALTLGVLGFGSLTWIYSSGFVSTSQAVKTAWIWPAVAIAVTGFFALTYGTNHLRTNVRTSLGGFLLGSLLAAGVGFAFNFESELTLLISVAILTLSYTFAARDISGGARSRLLGLVVLVAAGLSIFGDVLDTHLISFLSAAVVVMVGDQIFRRQPLHLASLDTSYGFYGSFQFLSWFGLVLAVAAGSKQLLGLLPTVLNAAEWSVTLGALIGLSTAIARIWVIRRQDLELENIDPRNSRLENLLGL